MGSQRLKAIRTFAAAGAIIGWFAIISQFFISASIRTVSLSELFFRFIGYFTITTNTLVALSFTFFALQSNSRIGNFFTRPGSFLSITVFMLIVGGIYSLVLRSLWKPEGFQLLIDELLHSVQPALFLIFWIIGAPKEGLQWKDFFLWLLYPIVYILYVIILGGLTGHYPYPFVDVSKLGYPRALLNVIGILVGSSVLALGLLGILKLKRNVVSENQERG